VLVLDDCGPHTARPVADPSSPPPERAGRWETLGAWLGLWTPPRDVVVPPVPRRRIAVGASVLVIVAAVLAVVVVPQVASDRAAARQRAAQVAADRHVAFLQSVDHEQRPRRGRGERDPAGAPPAQRRRARIALLRSARTRIERDARGRTTKTIRGVECERFPRSLDPVPPEADLGRPTATYDCVAVTSRLVGGQQGVIGMPFRLAADFEHGRYAWCRIVPLGDRDRLTHRLPRACLRPGA
jgi:hypothetical protein